MFPFFFRTSPFSFEHLDRMARFGPLIVNFRNVVSTLEAGFSVFHFLHDFSFFHHFSLSPRKWRQQIYNRIILFEVASFLRFAKVSFFVFLRSFSGDFRNMQQIPRNSVGLACGVLRLVFRLMTVGESANSLFWAYLDLCCFFMLFRVFGRFLVFFHQYGRYVKNSVSLFLGVFCCFSGFVILSRWDLSVSVVPWSLCFFHTIYQVLEGICRF